jgi:hypothetical protein
MRSRRSRKEQVVSTSTPSSKPSQVSRQGTVEKQRYLNDTVLKFKHYLTSTLSTTSMPHGNQYTIDQFMYPEHTKFNLQEYESFLTQIASTSQQILRLSITDLQAINTYLDLSAQINSMNIFPEYNMITNLPNIELLCTSFITRLNQRSVDSNTTLPLVVANMSLLIQRLPIASTVLTEQNISQLLKLCTSRAVYPLETECNEGMTDNGSYREVNCCR